MRRPLPSLALALAGLAVPVAAAPAATARDAARAWCRAHARGLIEEFGRLLAIPNRAGDTAQIERNARQIASMLEQRGFEVEQLRAGSGSPAVFGRLRAPGAARSLAIYAHYDGQPVDAREWTGEPFAPLLRDGPLEAGGRERGLDDLEAAGAAADEWRLYGRSTSDDKAPVMALLAAVDALQAAGIPRTVDLKVLFEGEEEAGSPNFETILRAHADRLRSDLWLICDGPVHASRRMQLFFGARGVTGVELTLYGAARPLHSGHYGNWAPNPALELARLLASLRDRDGRVTIAGFGDAVRAPSAAERRALAAVPDVEAALRRELALAPAEAGAAGLADSVMQPALNVRGLAAGHVGDLATNAIPDLARASIDFRLVPDQTPAGVRAAVEEHFRRQGFFVVAEEPSPDLRRAHARVLRAQWDTGYPAARTDMDGPLARDVRRVVDEAAGGTLVVVPTLGGSVPMRVFADVFGVPVIGLPIANHDNNQHAANENLRLRNLWDAVEVYAALLSRF